jgi:hypothetical protein
LAEKGNLAPDFTTQSRVRQRLAQIILLKFFATSAFFAAFSGNRQLICRKTVYLIAKTDKNKKKVAWFVHWLL